jgi:hypothetical protein
MESDWYIAAGFERAEIAEALCTPVCVEAVTPAGLRGRPGLRAPGGCAERIRMAETGWGWGSAGSRTARAVMDWLEGRLVGGRTRAHVLACSLGGSGGSGRLRGSAGPGCACLARLGSACDCVWVGRKNWVTKQPSFYLSSLHGHRRLSCETTATDKVLLLRRRTGLRGLGKSSHKSQSTSDSDDSSPRNLACNLAC